MARYGFEHWRAHMFSFWGRYLEPNYHVEENRLAELCNIVAGGLKDAGYHHHAAEILAADNEEALHRCLIRQYTTEGPFYEVINQGLRTAHTNVVNIHTGLVPWILQFNSMLRLRPANHETAYRGTNLTDKEVADYRVDEFFVWASFVSASRSPDACLGGNVLFELTPWGAVTEYEKRDARDLSEYSVFPEEEEVVFPLCCSFRVREKKALPGGVILICAEVVDCN